MSLEFRFRDWLRPPGAILREAGVRPGMTVLDFGCGPGGFSVAAARLVGPQGLVYAADIHPLAVKSVRKSAGRRGLKNIRTIIGSRMSDITDGEVDVVLLYDILHDLSECNRTLVELHRVLKPGGLLSVRDHHLKESFVPSVIGGSDLFSLSGHNRGTFRFLKMETSRETS